MLALVLYFVFSHIISFLCSIFESVLLSCTYPYIVFLKKKGSPVASILEELKRSIDRPLAAILTLNTISHTIGAAGVGASVVEVFGDKWLALGAVILTLTMLYWTEMLPKTIGALYWKGLVPYIARPIKWLIFVTYPFVITFNIFARLLSKGKRSDRITEEEIRVVLEAGVKAGVIEEAEQDMVENIFRLGDRRVGVLMRPRVDIDWIDANDPLASIRKKILASKHHCFPLCNNDVDQVIGMIDSRDLLAEAWMGKKIDIEKMATPPLFVNENQLIFELMDLFRKNHETIALVTDEYGMIQGMITIGDIMNAIVRDIEEEQQPQILKVNNRSWLLEGKLPIDEFKDFFHFEHLPNEKQARYRTLSGLCMNQLEAVPKTGDTFTIGRYRFEIVKVRKRRVEKLLLTQQDKFP